MQVEMHTTNGRVITVTGLTEDEMATLVPFSSQPIDVLLSLDGGRSRSVNLFWRVEVVHGS